MSRVTMSDLNRARDEQALVDAAGLVCRTVAPILARLPCRTPQTENSRAFLPTPDEMESSRAALMALAGVLERM